MYFPLKFFILRHTLYIYLLCTTCARTRVFWVGEGDVDEVRAKNMRLKESDAYGSRGMMLQWSCKLLLPNGADG